MRVNVRTPANYPGCPVTVDEALARGVVLRDPRWGLLDGFIPLIGAVVLAVVYAGVTFALGLPTAVVVTGGLVVPWIAMAGWPLWVTRRRGNGPVIDLGLRLRGADWGWGALAGVAAIFGGGLVALITVALFGEFTSAAAELAEELRAAGPIFLILFALFVVVGAPVVEELAFRGMLFAALTKRGVRPEWVIVLTALAFSLFHLEPVRIPLLFAVGLVFGYIRWKTRSLGAPIVAHAVNNLPGAIGLIVGFG